MKQDIIDCVNNSDEFVNFAEMSRRVEGFSGSISYGASEHYPHRVIWPTMSKEAIAIIEEIDGSDVFIWPTTIDHYAIEDRLDLPEESEDFNRNTDSSWLPMTFWKEPY